MRWENEWNRKRKSGRYKMRDARRPYLRLTRAGSLRWAYTYNTYIWQIRFVRRRGGGGGVFVPTKPSKTNKTIFLQFPKAPSSENIQPFFMFRGVLRAFFADTAHALSFCVRGEERKKNTERAPSRCSPWEWIIMKILWIARARHAVLAFCLG